MSIFVAVTVPAVVAAAAIGLRRVLGARERSSQGDSTWSSLAIGLAYIAGQAAVSRPAFPPVEVTDRIPWLALAATVLAVAEAVRARGQRGRPVAAAARLADRHGRSGVCGVAQPVGS